MITLWALAAMAAPVRAPLRPRDARWEPGRLEDVLIVKLAEDSGLRLEGGRLEGGGDLTTLNALLQGARPLFGRDAAVLRADRRAYDPQGRLASLDLYLRVRAADAPERARRLLSDPRIETAYLEYAPVPPPEDLPPTTPDFSDQQGYLQPAPGGLDLIEAWRWPGGQGQNVAIADVEYGWVHDHEDLEAAVDAAAWGLDSGYYAYHGSSVLGQLVAGDNGYGVVGMVPQAEPLVISPYGEDAEYNLADAIDGAAALLDAGDVLLIEQQSQAFGAYCPVEVSPAVFDAIALAVAKGVVVVEPGGNGGQDLDDPQWDGWFDRDERDSGAILVGGGASPDSGLPARSWYPAGGSYGSRVDLQGWYDSIVTATSADYDGSLADLYFPDHDERQAYTASFGGTSGASPMVAAAAVVAQSVAWQVWGAPWDPADLRAALISTGTPQDSDDTEHIGPQPDLRRLLRTWGVR